MTEHDRQVLRSIWGGGLPCSVRPDQAKASAEALLSAGMIERGTDPREDAGSLVYRVTEWGRAILGVSSHIVQ